MITARSAIFILLCACAPPVHFAHMHNPIRVASVEQNEIDDEARLTESERGLPAGTLVDRAVLAEVSSDRICVRTSLWALEINPERGRYSSWVAQLLSEDGRRIDADEIAAAQSSFVSTDGHMAFPIAIGTRQVCGSWVPLGRSSSTIRHCFTPYTETVYGTRYEAHRWQIGTYPARVCFPNRGVVRAETRRVAVELRNTAQGEDRVFEWLFDER